MQPPISEPDPAVRQERRGPWTWDDFAALPDDDRRELVDGELVEIEVPTKLHEHIVVALGAYLYFWARTHKAGVLGSGYRVRISEERGVMPDIQLYRSGNTGTRTKQGLTQGAPDLAIEVVSDSSERYDRVTKLNWYASIGCPEYWIVDPEARTVERFVLKEGRFVVMQSFADSEVFKPETFPGLAIPLAELWTIPGEETGH
jgi:Uma2 family endonuclease